MSSRVLVNQQKVDFGQCFHSLLLNGQPPPLPGRSSLFVQWELNSQTLELNLSLCKAEAKHDDACAPFEHFPVCPAQAHNAPNPKLAVKIGVATLLESRDGRVLITQRHSQLRSFPNIWVLPGGHLDAGETLYQAAARELDEETSLRNVQCEAKLLGIWESTFPHLAEIGSMTHHHAVCYVHSHCLDVDYLEVQTNEVQAVAWLTREQVRAILSQCSTVSVDVFRVDPVIAEEAAANGDWHKHRAKVSATAQQQVCDELYDSMSAGTHFALRKWLEKTNQPKM